MNSFLSKPYRISRQNHLSILRNPHRIHSRILSEFLLKSNLITIFPVYSLKSFQDTRHKSSRILIRISTGISYESFRVSLQNPFRMCFRICFGFSIGCFQDSSQNISKILNRVLRILIRTHPGVSSESFEYSQQNPSRMSILDFHQNVSWISYTIFHKFSSQSFQEIHQIFLRFL